MKNEFYYAIKEKFDDENFNINEYENIMDIYLNSLECKGKECSKFEVFKDFFNYILKKYNRLLKLKNQNEEIFSQILHDIKSPMLGAKFALDSVHRNELEEEIYNINLNVLNIIQDFLTLYSFKDGFKTPYFSDIYPIELTKKELNLYAPLLRQKCIRIIFPTCSNLKIYSCGAIFSRIVSNLLSNAIKYAPLQSDIEIGFVKNKKNIIFKISNLLIAKQKKDELSFGMGLLITKRLARRIKSTLCIKKSENKIVFELKIPKTDRLNRVR